MGAMVFWVHRRLRIVIGYISKIFIFEVYTCKLNFNSWVLMKRCGVELYNVNELVGVLVSDR